MMHAFYLQEGNGDGEKYMSLPRIQASFPRGRLAIDGFEAIRKSKLIYIYDVTLETTSFP